MTPRVKTGNMQRREICCATYNAGRSWCCEVWMWSKKFESEVTTLFVCLYIRDDIHTHSAMCTRNWIHIRVNSSGSFPFPNYFGLYFGIWLLLQLCFMVVLFVAAIFCTIYEFWIQATSPLAQLCTSFLECFDCFVFLTQLSDTASLNLFT